MLSSSVNTASNYVMVECLRSLYSDHVFLRVVCINQKPLPDQEGAILIFKLETISTQAIPGQEKA